MKTVQVHRVNFFEPEPQAIRCLSYDRASSRLAVSRADSSIQIWNMKENSFLEKVIPGSPTISIESLEWCRGRLFSVGLYGYITEHNLTTLLPKYQLSVASGASIWCIKADKEQKFLAIGNEDGHVVLHGLSLEGLDFEKKFYKQEGCILCLDWHAGGQVIVTGSIDVIRVWDVSTGRVINRIILERTTKNTPTVVWCIAITRDMTIVSGDSCGKTSFWESSTGTLLDAFNSEKGDILALCKNEGDNVVYSSGVDPTITMHMKSPTNGKWLKSIQRVVHTHDVRSLLLVREFLVSGGDDCNLVLTKYPPKTTITFFPFCDKSYTVTASDASLLLISYPNFIEIWSIGTSSDGQSKPTNLLRVKPKKNENIICSSISNNGKWLAYSSQFQLKLFYFKMDTSSEALPAVYKTSTPEKVSAATKILFTSEPTRLISYSTDEISIIRCDTMSSTLDSVIDIESDLVGQLNLMELSPDSAYLACGFQKGHVVIYNINDLKIHCKLPLYKCEATALKFDPSSTHLVVVYSDRKVIEYKIREMAYSSWSRKQQLVDFQNASYHPITSVCFLHDRLLLQDENAIYVFNREEEIEPDRKRIKQLRYFSEATDSSTFSTISKYEHISSIHSFQDDLVVVQVSASRIIECLPPPVFKKKYGT